MVMTDCRQRANKQVPSFLRSKALLNAKRDYLRQTC